MAKRTVITLEDDLDHSTDGVTTHQFALDNVTWEIDLSEPNLARLRQALQPFIGEARRLPTTQRARRTRRRQPPGTRGSAPTQSAAG